MIKNEYAIKRLCEIKEMIETKAATLESSSVQRFWCSHGKHPRLQHKFCTENYGIKVRSLKASLAQRKSKDQYLLTTLLDFLYPLGTLEVALEAKVLNLNKSVKRPTRILLSKNEKRFFSSLAFTQTSSGPKNKWEEFQKIHPNAAFLLKESGISPEVNPSQVWEKFKCLIIEQKKQLSHAILCYLQHSFQESNENMIIEFFRELGSHEKDEDICDFVIQACLEKNDLPNALKVYYSPPEKSRTQCGCIKILCYTIKNRLWSQAYKLWISEKFLYADFNFYRFLDESEQNISVCQSLVNWIDQVHDDPGVLQSPDFMKFRDVFIANSLKLIESCSENEYTGLLRSIKDLKLHDKEIYTNSILSLAKKQKNDLLLKSYSVLRLNNNFHLSKAALLKILDISCNRHDVLLIKQVLDDFFSLHLKPNREAYRMCLKEFSRQGDAKTVHALFNQYVSRYKVNSIESLQEMRQKVKLQSKLDKSGRSYCFEKIDESAPLTANDFAPVLHVHAKRGEVREVEKIFDQILDVYGIEQDLLCWNILLSAYIKIKHTEKAYDCFEEILEKPNIQPDHYTLGTMMALCASRADLGRAKNIYNLAKVLKVPMSSAILNGLVVCLLRNERYKDADVICFESTSMNLIGPKTPIWNSLIVGYAMNRDITNVNRIFNHMFEKNIDYDQYTYSALMQALVMTRQPNLAAKILTQVMPKSGIMITSFHFAVLLGGYLAVKNWELFFQTYQKIQEHKLKHNASTKFLTLRATTSQDAELFQNGTSAEKFTRSFQIFSETMASMDPQDISETAKKGFGQIPLDIMYPAIFYSFTAFVLSQYGEYKISLKLLQEYQSWLPEDRRKSGEIMKVLTAMMSAKHLAHDNEGVKEGWENAVALARKESEQLPPIPGVKDLDETPEYSLLYFHQLKLNDPFEVYMKNLVVQRKFKELNKTVEDLVSSGFELDNHNWNSYVKNLARSSTFCKLAFQVCERKLMPGWQGWRIKRHKLAGRRTNVPLYVRQNKRNPRLFRPFFDTMLWLARRMIDLQTRAAESYEIQKFTNFLKHEYPLTTKAIDGIPRSGSTNESILKLDKSQFEL